MHKIVVTPITGILGLILGYASLFIRTVPSYEILYICFLNYSDSHCTKKNFTACIPLQGGGALCSIFGRMLV